MGAVVGITAYLQAKNQLSPELSNVVQSAKRAQREFTEMDRDIQKVAKEMRQMKQAAEKSIRAMAQEMQQMRNEFIRDAQAMRNEFAQASDKMRNDFSRDVSRMQSEINQLRSEMRSLGGVHASPKVTIDNKASDEINNVKQDLMSIGALAAGITLGLGGGGIVQELEQLGKEQGYYAAKGAPPEEMQTFKKEAERLVVDINPYMEKPEIMSLLNESRQFFDKEKAKIYAEIAAKLDVTTGKDASEHLKMSAAMEDSFPVDDPQRIGDSLQHIFNVIRDLRDSGQDSIIEYSPQMAKVFDTPEQMATYIEQLSKIKTWDIDKGFDAPKEAMLTLSEIGAIESMLKAGYGAMGVDDKSASEKAATEAKQMYDLLHSKNEADNKQAMGMLMSYFSTYKDPKVRDAMLVELAKGPGEDVGKKLIPILDAVGKVTTGEIKPTVKEGQLDKSYNAAKEANPLFEFYQASNEAKQALVSLGGVVAEDITPALSWLADKAKAAKEGLEGMSGGAALAIVGATATATALSLFMLGKAANMALDSMIEGVITRRRGRKGGDDSDIDIDPPAKDPRKKKRRWFGGGKDDDIDPPKKLSYEEKSERALREQKAKKEPADVPPKKQSVLSKLGGMWDGAGNRLWENTKSIGKGVLKKLPVIGALATAGYGAAEILGAENKKEAALRVGANLAGGALGGAAMGAALGSIVPGLGTAIGGAIGAALGGAGADKLFDKAKAWWNKLKPPEQPAKPPEQPPKPPAPPPPPPKPPAPPPPPPKQIPHPGQAAVTQQVKQDVKVQTNAGPVSVTMNAQGILQDVNGLVRLLHNGTVQSTIKGFILPAVEKAIVDAIQTRGGPPAPVAPAPANSLPGGGGRQPK